MIHLKYQLKKDKTVLFLHLEILDPSQSLGLISVNPGLHTKIQINSSQFQLIMLERLVLISQ